MLNTLLLTCLLLCYHPLTTTLAEAELEVIATITSCWPEVYPYIESVAQTDECYKDGLTGEISCFKFEDDIQDCESDWTETVVQDKKDWNYIITKAKYQLPPNSTFTIRMDMNIKINKFLDKLEMESCFNITVYSDVMSKKYGCATFEIYEDGYHATISKIAKNTPCTRQPGEGVVCFKNMSAGDLTTKAVNDLRTDLPTSSISDSATSSPHLEPSTEPFPVSLVIIIGSASLFVVILLSIGCFCFGKYNEKKSNQTETGTSKQRIHDDVVLIPMQRGICNATYDKPEPLYAVITENSTYTDLLRSRSETALNVGGGLLLPNTGSLQKLDGCSKWNTLSTCRAYQAKINSGYNIRTSGTQTYFDSSVAGADYSNTLKLVSGSKTTKTNENSKQLRSYKGDDDKTFGECRSDDYETVNDKQTTGQGDGSRDCHHRTGTNNDTCGELVDKDGYLALDLAPVRTSDDELYLQPEFCGDVSSKTDIHDSHSTDGDGKLMGLPGYTALQRHSIEGYTDLKYSNSNDENKDSDYLYPDIASTN